MSLYSLVYVSSATKDFTDHDLQGLLKLAREKMRGWALPACCYTVMVFSCRR